MLRLPSGRVLGEIVIIGGLKVYRKHVRRSKHLFNSGPAWGWDAWALEEAERLGAKSVLILDDESGRGYHATIEDVRRFGFELDLGHGRQTFLRLSRFAVTDARGQPVRTAPCSRLRAEPVAGQLAMF